MAAQERRATRDAWKTTAMPQARAPVTYTRVFDAHEHVRIANGLVPLAMEDKWFIYFEDGWLRLHRSWTGFCIYEVRLREQQLGGSVVEEAWVNRERSQYGSTDDARDAQMLEFIVERLLLGRDVRFPAASPGMAGDLYRHHVVGNARSSDEE